MINNIILFDDWQTRCADVFKQRRREYMLCLILIGISNLFVCVGIFFEPVLIVPLVLFIIVFVVLLLEWLKVKNNHLVIKSNQIEVTNRFNKTTIHRIHIHELTLRIKHSFNHRSGGIILIFCDSKDNIICKYEDMLNNAAPWGFEKTSWERGIEGLGIKVLNPEKIIKN